MFRFLLFASLVWVCHGLQWMDNLPDNSRVEACEGGDIALLFNYTLSEGEKLQDTKWIFHAQPEKEIIAMLMYNQFLVMPPFDGRVQRKKEGGITISGATPLESGNYSIKVRAVDQNKIVNKFQKTAIVQVVEIPKASGGRLHVQQSAKGVYDNSTKEWKVQLSCGVLADRGQPSLDVEWTTPDGHNLHSSSSDNNGTFYLLLDNPPTGGNYVCRLAPDTSCLPSKSPLREGAAVVVSDVKAAFSLLEAKQTQSETEMKAENNQLKAEIARLTLEDVQQKAEMQQLQSKLELVSHNVAFHAQLSSNLNAYKGTIKPYTVLYNNGNAFDATNGLFTSPMNGSYYFSGTAANGGQLQWVYFELQKNGHAFCFSDAGHFESSASAYTVGTCHGVIYLGKGETVRMQSTSYVGVYYWHSGTFFSGFLLSAHNEN